MAFISLRAARVNAGLRQTDVASELGVNVATIGNWEKGHTLPNAFYLRQLAELYGIQINDFSLPEKFR